MDQVSSPCQSGAGSIELTDGSSIIGSQGEPTESEEAEDTDISLSQDSEVFIGDWTRAESIKASQVTESWAQAASKSSAIPSGDRLYLQAVLSATHTRQRISLLKEFEQVTFNKSCIQVRASLLANAGDGALWHGRPLATGDSALLYTGPRLEKPPQVLDGDFYALEVRRYKTKDSRSKVFVDGNPASFEAAGYQLHPCGKANHRSQKSNMRLAQRWAPSSDEAFVLVLHAARPIVAGEELTWNYFQNHSSKELASLAGELGSWVNS